jgi:phosphofructokinase-like protein
LKRLGILTSGGDCAGLNSVIRAVVLRAVRGYGIEVWGIHEATHGLLQRPVAATQLTPESVRGILHLGGTILRTTNRGNPFAYPADSGAVDRSAEIIEGYREIGLDALIGVGGDGSLAILRRLAQQGGWKLIGVPKTIDNDLGHTEHSIGFGTAVAVATEAVDRLHVTAASHNRVMVLEVMGRDAGWIALHSGIGGGADAILIPEIPFSMDAIVAKVQTRDMLGAHFSIIVVSEGANEKGGGQMYQETTGTLGGIGHHVGQQIAHRSGKDTRVVVLGHLQRGGVPTPYDRILATRFGAGAVRALAEGHHSEVVVLNSGQIGTVGMAECAGRVKTVPLDAEEIRTARGIGIAFGDEDMSLTGTDSYAPVDAEAPTTEG